MTSPSDSPTEAGLLHGLEVAIRALVPEAVVEKVTPFQIDEADAGETTVKAMGYGQPLKVMARGPDGAVLRYVLHTATPNPYGHAFRADRAAEMLLAYDTFNDIPGHVRAIDVGGLGHHGELVSLRDVGELYVLTEYAPGHPYAEELRRIGETGEATATDVMRAGKLAGYLADLHIPPEHVEPDARPALYRRAIRDLVGSGEGLAGIADGYPPEYDERLAGIERAALRWRHRLKRRGDRLVRTHGDFHPFNILFDDAHELRVLDASRGCLGDAADDVTALSINYPFFALMHPGTWERGFGPLWTTFWRGYAASGKGGGQGLFEVVAPFWAWRTLVVASPVWYPDIDPAARERMLKLAEDVLAADTFDPDLVVAMMAGAP